jgi:glycosyltransferase 2 family protein
LLGVATIANLGTLVVKGIRWTMFLDAVGIHGTGQALRTTFAGHALNNVLVANGGDAVRVAATARNSKVSSATVLATLAIDKLCDLVSYAAVFAIAAIWLPLPPQLARWRTAALIALAVMGIALAGLVLWRPKHPHGEGLVAAEQRLVERARNYWRRLTATSAELATARRLTPAVALSFVAWAGQWATFHYAAHAAAFPTTPADSLLALLVVNLSFVVRLTPGNIGVFQLLYALAATSTGLDKDSAVAVAFLISLIQYIPVTVIGLLLARSLTTDARASATPPSAEPTAPNSERSVAVGGEHGRRT